MKKLLAAALILCMVGAWGSIAYRNIAVPNEYENNYAKAGKPLNRDIMWKR